MISEKNIVGIWKHHKDQVYLMFCKDNKMSIQIPLNYKVIGQYRFINNFEIELVLVPQYFLTCGEVIQTDPIILKIIIKNNNLFLYGITQDKLEGELFIKIL
jgi:hypothetical protein